MRFLTRLLLPCALALLLPAAVARAADKPDGKILYQPQLLWANSMTTLQGTGYVIAHGGKLYGVTSVHFLDFEAGGLRAATWLDVYSERPLATFRASLGRPARTAFPRPTDVAHDFLLLPCNAPPEEGVALQLEDVARYEPGTRLWFPSKSRQVETGHDWIDATVVEDLGHLLRVRLASSITLESQSGSPLLNAATGKVVGMIHSGTDERGATILTLCPARSIVKFLGRRQELTSLLSSIRRRR